MLSNCYPPPFLIGGASGAERGKVLGMDTLGGPLGGIEVAMSVLGTVVGLLRPLARPRKRRIEAFYVVRRCE